MKRMHLHVRVTDLPQSIRFYSTLFGIGPSVEKADYAKWILEDPRVNFAISARGQAPGLDHVGIQVETADELEVIQARLQAADMAVLSQTDATCCYAKSDKHWVQDPSGLAWESYLTLESAPTFNDAGKTTASAPCCTPMAQPVSIQIKKKDV